MIINKKDVKVGNEYLCRIDNDVESINSYIVKRISSSQNYIEVLLNNDLNSKWFNIDVFLSSVIEKLDALCIEDLDALCIKDEELSYADCEIPVIIQSNLKKIDNEHNKKVDTFQKFMDMQTEYLKMLIKEKKETEGWKE